MRRLISSALIPLFLLFSAPIAFYPSARAEIISIRNQGEVTATTTAQQLVAANMRRKYLLVQNKGSRTIYLKFETAPTGTQGIEIPPGGNYESVDMPISPAFVKTNSGSSAVFFMEGQ